MNLLRPILAGALVAGALDLIYACVHFGLVADLSPMVIFQSIAAGLIGSSAASAGGWASASLGFGLEFVLTAIMAAIYVFAARCMPDLRRVWWLLGPCYGIILMVGMYLVVLPLAMTQSQPELPDGPGHQFLYGSLFAHMFLVGLPISAAARYLWPSEDQPEAQA